MSIGGSTGQVLGASTSIAAGVAVLPQTGLESINAILPIVAIIVGISVLLVLIVSRIIRVLRK